MVDFLLEFIFQTLIFNYKYNNKTINCFTNLYHHMSSDNFSQILFLIFHNSIVWTIFLFNWWWSNCSITFLRPYNKLLFAEISPIWYSFLSASLPLLLCEYSELFDDFLCLHLLYFSVVAWLLDLYYVIFLLLELFKDVLADLLVLILEGRLW